MPITEAEFGYPLRSARLFLQPIALDDAGDVQASCLDWESVRYTSSIPYPYPENGAQKFITEALAKWDQGTYRLLAARKQDDATYVGQFGLTFAEDDPGRAEISYIVTRSVWGQGFGGELARAGIDHAFRDLGLTSLYARVFLANEPSNRLIRRLGMRFEKVVRIHAPARACDVDVNWYELDRADWKEGGR
ncbi:MAG: GNAT family N-acetyltransferase [Alphaproteobacteria bacterium]|jgi:RimJ/RimL family protein N-acetyltransferase|uniref:GNAT family N-acetyltransferase n=1 Tax=Pacificispira sp. TaxID=2888761 RepID=UPI001B23FC4D|nr:GNAT family N-acetyltransferase [Alphaproteobacteria bacterium]MBO6865138.1 GNAT family N-acetyltransferase [Alphaproteobacteria bacterium]MEC9267136.1 GNAT family protein [Pseudomonadota bacterium]